MLKSPEISSRSFYSLTPTAVFFILAFLFAPPARLSAQVDREELNKNQAPVFFINYEGPHSRIESRQQIRNIGYSLGQAVRSGAASAGGTDRYFVIHSVSGPDGNKLDADIFGLGIDVGVDHIRNLRFIIQGYLEGAYAYGERDAALLAEYITIYNAVYRGDWNYFTGRYKAPVLQHLNREKAGLSIRYDDWPGQTLMIIPLGPGGAGSLSAVNTTSLTEDRVTDELRKEEDRGVEQRKDMVDLLEREADEAEQRAEVQREAIAEEERRITGERQENAEEREQIAREREQVREDLAEGRITGEDARAAEEELAEREAEADQRDGELEQREDALVEQREEARAAEEFAEQKAQEAQEEREEIARDQQALIVQEDNPPPAEKGILAAIMSGPSTPLGWLLHLNPSTGTELRRSLLNTVNSRTLTFVGDRLLAVAGETRGSGAIRLVEISPDTLEMVKQGEDDISPNSLIWVNGTDLFAISSSGGNFYLTRFNAALAREARSSVQVHPYATVDFQEGFILTQRTDGSALVLNPKDLSERK